MLLTVATIIRPHGLRGEVVVDVRTDDPDRLSPGAVFATDRPQVGALTLVAARSHQNRLLVTFQEVGDRTAAEGLRGVSLVVEAGTSDDEDAWYPHELAGLQAVGLDGRNLGTVEGLENSPAHDLLVLREPDGSRTLVPFVHAIVPEVDVAGGRVVLDPPGGLLAWDSARLEVVESTAAEDRASTEER